MKIIDLYYLIANKKYDKLPDKIMLKGYDYIFSLREDCGGYKWYGEVNSHDDFGEKIHQNLEYILNCEVEILDDEEKGLPEKLKLSSHWGGTFKDEQKFRNDRDDEIAFKINEIIDYLEKQSKGE